MLHFEGEGYIYKDNEKINRSRDEIIKSGWKNNANIPKVNEILKRFHTQELSDIEMLEFIIKNNVSDMNLNSPHPKLADFGLVEKDIDKINNIEKILFVVGVILYIGGAFVFVELFEDTLFMNFVHKLIVALYALVCILYLKNNKEYTNNRKMFKSYKRVSSNYKNRYEELQHVEIEKEKQRIENERKRQEELRRQEERRRKEEELRKQRELREHKDYWYNLNPYEFEEKIGDLFRDLGYEVTVTKKSGDGGIDAIIQRGNIIKAVQCKRYKAKLTEPAVRDLWGAKDYVKLKGRVVKADGAIMVALSGVTPQAKTFINHFSEYELWTIDTIITKANLVNYNYTKK